MHHTRTTPIRSHRFLLALAAAAALTTGCADLGQIDDARADLVTWSENARAEAEALRAELAELPADHPTRPQVEALLAALETRATAADAGLAQLDTLLAEAQNPQDPFTQTAERVGNALPEPIRTPLLLAGAAAALFWRARTLKRGLASVARGIQIASRDDQEFRACFQRHADTFRHVQTPAAQRVVDEATHERPMLKLPI